MQDAHRGQLGHAISIVGTPRSICESRVRAHGPMSRRVVHRGQLRREQAAECALPLQHGASGRATNGTAAAAASIEAVAVAAPESQVKC